MDNLFRYFILVAESLNMSVVAREKNVSHQCISTHIKKLEAKFHVKLFNRRPKLSLTKEGEIMLNAVKQMRMIEEDLFTEFTDVSENCRGRLRMGIPLSRYGILVPFLLPEFKAKYPNVEVEVVSDFSNVLEAKTVNGEIDLFIGMGKVGAGELISQHLLEESFFLIVSDLLLHRHFGGEYAECCEKFKGGVSIGDFKNVPLVLTPKPSRLRKTIDTIADEGDFELNVAFETNHVGTFGQLCQKNMGACIISHMFLSSIKALNSSAQNGEHIHVFPVKDLHCSNVWISFVGNRYVPRYQKYFIYLAKKFFGNYKLEKVMGSI